MNCSNCLKAKIFVWVVAFHLSGFAFGKANNIYRDLVVGEIQKTFMEDYQVKKSYFRPINTNPPPRPPVVAPPPKKKVVKKEKKQAFPKKRGLIDFDDKPFKGLKKESKKGLAKGRAKGRAKGLQEEEDFTPEPIDLPKRKTAKDLLNNSPQKKQGLEKRGDWMGQKLKEKENFEKQSSQKVQSWYLEKQKMLKEWAQDKKRFLKSLPSYKKNLVNYNRFGSASATKPSQKFLPSLKAKAQGNDFFTIPKAFFSKVKDQGKRPTCAAFAATRALEISLAQKGQETALSEQYFYFASKPYCQSTPCSKKGSWALNAFNKSIRSQSPDIPLDKDCPYSKISRSGNETQLPLQSGCFQGRHKLKRFEKVQSLREIKRSLDQGHPVVSAFKLSPNFFRNKGVVLYKDSFGKASNNPHAAGHAVLLIGHMKIPASLGEGAFCFLTANSWGTGWGKGGHACLSEKWVQKYRFSIPFLAVNLAI